MSLITGGRTSRFLQKYFGIKGEIAAPELGPEVHPVVQVTNLPFEHRVLDSILSYWEDTGTNTGDATHPCTYFLVNPAGSNVQCVIKRLLVWYTPGTPPVGITVGPIKDALANVPTRFGQIRDSRGRPTAAPGRSVCGTVAFTTTGAPISGFENLPIGQPVAGLQLHIPFDCGEGLVLNPKEMIEVGTHNNTESLALTWWWTERAYEPSELSLT